MIRKNYYSKITESIVNAYREHNLDTAMEQSNPNNMGKKIVAIITADPDSDIDWESEYEPFGQAGLTHEDEAEIIAAMSPQQYDDCCGDEYCDDCRDDDEYCDDCYDDEEYYNDMFDTSDDDIEDESEDEDESESESEDEDEDEDESEDIEIHEDEDEDENEDELSDISDALDKIADELSYLHA